MTKRLFAATAIALALALFGVEALPEREVRERVSPWTTVGTTAASGWCTLSRWTAAIQEGRLFSVRRAPETWTPRQVAARAATTLAATAPQQAASIATAAFDGALAD